VLDMDKTQVRRNSEWFDAMKFEDLLRLASRMTVAQMIQRDTFHKRMQESAPIGIHEFLYPLMQGWDSVCVKADVELVGTDQLFNLLVGRQLQEQVGQRPQVVLTQPLINGLDGRKMSKSFGNTIQLTDEAVDVFGKTMSITDEAMETWFLYLTRLPQEEIDELLRGHPREAKARLAEAVTAFLHGDESAAVARAAFDRQFQAKVLPDNIPERVHAPWPREGLPLAALLRDVQLAASSSEARRLIQQGGVRVNGEVVRDVKHVLVPPREKVLLQVGKRKYLRLSGK